MVSEKTGRNALDVVMELVDIHIRHTGEELTEEEIKRLYNTYYDLVSKRS